MQQGQNGITNLPMMMWSPMFWLGTHGSSNEQSKTGLATGISADAMKAGSQAGNEIMGLVSRRSQAYLTFAAEAAKCRAPHELLALQMQFIQTAFQHHSEAARKIASAWNIALPMVAAAGAATSGRGSSTIQRDRISFAEADSAAGSQGQSVRTSGDRRSAA